MQDAGLMGSGCWVLKEGCISSSFALAVLVATEDRQGMLDRNIRPRSDDLRISRTLVLFGPEIVTPRPNLTIQIPGRLRRRRNATFGCLLSEVRLGQVTLWARLAGALNRAPAS